MVMITGIQNSRVLKPIIIKRQAKNSAKLAHTRPMTAGIPKREGKETSPPDINFIILM